MTPKGADEALWLRATNQDDESESFVSSAVPAGDRNKDTGKRRHGTKRSRPPICHIVLILHSSSSPCTVICRHHSAIVSSARGTTRAREGTQASTAPDDAENLHVAASSSLRRARGQVTKCFKADSITYMYPNAGACLCLPYRLTSLGTITASPPHPPLAVAMISSLPSVRIGSHCAGGLTASMCTTKKSPSLDVIDALMPSVTAPEYCSPYTPTVLANNSQLVHALRNSRRRLAAGAASWWLKPYVWPVLSLDLAILRPHLRPLLAPSHRCLAGLSRDAGRLRYAKIMIPPLRKLEIPA
ncbi:hypothetical protein F4824DRAFT_500177 [Ustulina deusta]|nr:hypothetical protein F4824DRAFT_500177 [Ustulina deusta]